MKTTKLLIASMISFSAACSLWTEIPNDDGIMTAAKDGETDSGEVMDGGEIEANDAGSGSSVCPENFILIDGEYCPRDDAKCLYWVNAHGIKTKVMTDRCGEFRKPVHCLAPTIHKHYCIAKFEYPNKEGSLPIDWVSFKEAEKIAKANGHRLCTGSEWAFASLGPNNDPYPFGDHYHRDHSCNIDRHASEVGLTGKDIMSVRDPNSKVAQQLRGLLVPSGSLPDCKSWAGVYDLSGNEDEIVINESGKPYRSELHGGFSMGVRNKSRCSTQAHNESFEWYESSFRECADAQ